MNISAISIRNPIPVIMFFLVSILAGLWSFKTIDIQNFPDMSLPTISINAVLPGAAPPQLETEVAKKLENSIASLEGLKNITTKINDGSVSIIAEFVLEKDAQEALDEVRSAISTARGGLPQEMDEPIVNKVKFSNMPIKIFSISSNSLDDEQLSWYVDNDITKKLLSINGVGEVKRVGGKNREVQVLIDPIKLKSYAVTVADLSRQIKALQLDASAGKMEIGASEQPIRAIASVNSAEELANIEISTTRGVKIKLSDLAEIKDSYAKITSSAFFNGKSVIGFEVTRTQGADELKVAEDLQKTLDKLSKDNEGVSIVEVFDFVEPVQIAYTSSMQLLFEGALLAVLVVYIFLKDWRATVVSAIALPLSVIPTFAFMYMADFSINVITLLSLSLVVGILVDDAIVEVENIERHMADGKTAYEAAIEATQEIGLAVVATTFTLIAVFLPTAFMSGIPGLVFKQFGWTSAIAVFVSLVVARLLTPLMAAYIMKAKKDYPHKDPAWLNKYLVIANWSIKNRFKTILLAVIFFVASLAIIPLLPKGFIPANNSNQGQISVELTPGSSLEQTEEVVKKVEEKLKEVPEILSYYSTVGGGNAGMRHDSGSLSDPRKATISYKTKAKNDRDPKGVVEARIREVLNVIPGAKISVGNNATGTSYNFSLVSDDGDALIKTANQVEEEIRGIPGVGNISSGASLDREEISLKINFNKASELGVNTTSIAQTIRVSTQGDFNNYLSKLNTSSRQIPIVVKMNDIFKEDLENLLALEIESKNGMIPLAEVVDVSYSNSPSVINRYNRSRTIDISVELGSVELGDMVKKIQALNSIQNMPPEVKILETGDAEKMAELFGGFGLAMLTGILCIYIILILLFKDVLQPITILMALPLSLGGAFLGLLISGESFSMPSLIGLIMLMGVATKNSILLVDYAIILKKEGMSQFDATLDACRKRARPIIMTTIAMGVGMLPIALDLGSGDGTFRAPMAIAVIGGLITSTILSLIVIPAVFTVIEDLKYKIKKKFGSEKY